MSASAGVAGGAVAAAAAVVKGNGQEEEEEEVPLEITDYSSDNVFEEAVHGVESYLFELFQQEPRLHALVHDASAVQGSHHHHECELFSSSSCSSSSSNSDEEEDELRSCTSSHSDHYHHHHEEDENVRGSRSPASRSAAHKATTQPLVRGRLFQLRRDIAAPNVNSRVRCVALVPNAGEDIPLDAFSVEVHLCDAAHAVSRLFCLPFFFLIRSVNVHATYRASESLYYLSILTTAVGNVFAGSPFTLDLTGLYARVAALAVDGAESALGTNPNSNDEAEIVEDEEEGGDDDGAMSHWLASPFTLPAHCAPCLVPVGDQHTQSYRGTAPPSVLGAASLLLPRPLQRSPAHVLLASLFARPSFGIRFWSTAHASARSTPYRSLSSLIDLFQLQLGPQSRLQTDFFDGICVSLRKTYRLSVPWQFRPPLTESERAARGGSTTSAAPDPHPSLRSSCEEENDERDDEMLDEPRTWSEVMQRENEALQLVCGPCTHALGTEAAPLAHVEFVFAWDELRDGALVGRSAEDEYGPDPFHLTRDKVLKPPWLQGALSVRAVLGHHPRRLLYAVQAGLPPWVQRMTYHLTRIAAGELDAAASLREREAGAGGATAPSASAHTSGAGTIRHRTRNADTVGQSVYEEEDEGEEDMARAELDALVAELMATRVSANTRAVHEALIARLYAQQGEEEKGRKDRQCPAGVSADPRLTYPPDSLLSRLAYLSTTRGLSPRMTCTLWRRCINALRDCIEGRDRSGVVDALRVLGLPPHNNSNNNGDDDDDVPVVDLTRSLLVQKCQLLAHCLALMSREETRTTSTSGSHTRRSTDGWDLGEESVTHFTSSSPEQRGGSRHASPITNTTDTARRTLGEESAMRLITNGEPMRVPPPLPTAPCTTDMLQQRALELNALGTGRSAQITRTWLQSDSLYNDMCLFLYVNEAQKGRVVRFPDFVHWHSPRDFVAPAEGTACDAVVSETAEGGRTTREDNAYLSARMQHTDSMTGQTNIWWYLWQRAGPCSYEEILADSFRPHEQATLLLRWLARSVSDSLIVGEVVHASLVNALHRPLSHRLVIDAAKAHKDKGNAAVKTKDEREEEGEDGDGGAIPALRTWLRGQTAAIANVLLSASTMLGVAQETSAGPAIPVDAAALQAMYDEVITRLVRMNTALCAAIALEEMFGRHSIGTQSPRSRAACRLLRELSSPRLDESGALYRLKACDVSMGSWLAFFARRFDKEADRRPARVLARLTCMAERPLHTAGCMQQLTMSLRDNDVMCLAVTLSHEVQ